MSDIFQTFLLIFSIGSTECDRSCHKLPKVPPRWNYNGTAVPMFTYMCSVNSSSNLDIARLLKKDTEVDQFDLSTFVSVDLYIDCNGEKLGKKL